MEHFGDGKHNDQIAKLTAALTLTQPGCVLLYYGEELGMATMPASDLHRVPTSAKRPRSDDRDGERTPMQWNSSANAGFSTGSPWLPPESNFSRYNFESEKADPNSIYAWYRHLLKLRHRAGPLKSGDYVPLESGNRDVFAFARRGGDRELALIALNMSATTQKLHIRGMPGSWLPFHKVLMASP